ncbi:unnamed protein product [Sphagnum jensenii]|uniref:AAA ATPase AAA+ lid domain-containing protein n=1 Tax=Sphagnum jensenii TaxID=128206 RepID=A0ABP0WU08_9BRYO
MLGLMNGALWQVISANDADRINILQLCVKWPLFPILSPSSGQQTASFDQQQRHSLLNGRLETVLILEEKKPKSVEMDTQLILETRSMMNTIVISNSKINNISGNVVSLHASGRGNSSMVAMLLSGQAVAPKLLVANMPTALLYWPLMQLAVSANDDVVLGIALGSRGGGTVRGGTCDVRAALLLLLIGKCNIYQVALDEVGGNEFFSADVDLKELASKTKNFSGAELEGLVKSATSFALNRQVSAADLSREIVEDNIKVTMDDFMSALNEVKPAFGAAINTLEMCRLNGMLDCGERHAHIQRTVMTFVEQVSFKVREHLCSLASLKDLVAVVRQHWQQLLELKVVFHSLKLLCFQCSVQSSTMLSMHFNGHFREHRRV